MLLLSIRVQVSPWPFIGRRRGAWSMLLAGLLSAASFRRLSHPCTLEPLCKILVG